jgi:NAD(P)H-flavin reductase
VPLVTVPIVEIAASTPRSRLLTLDLAGQRFPFTAGQAVLMAPSGDADRRPFSLACAPEQVAESGRLELLIAADGNDLRWATAGNLVDLDGPLGTFTLPASLGDHRLLFVAGGTGIAPLRAMIGHLLLTDPGRRISVLYSARRSDEFAFIDELREHELARRLVLQQTVTRDDSSSWQGRRGRIGRAEFEAVLEEPERTLCFVCGPPAMVDESVTVLKALGVPATAIRTEQWGR